MPQRCYDLDCCSKNPKNRKNRKDCKNGRKKSVKQKALITPEFPEKAEGGRRVVGVKHYTMPYANDANHASQGKRKMQRTQAPEGQKGASEASRREP